MDLGNYLPPYVNHPQGQPVMINVFNMFTLTKLALYILVVGLVLSLILVVTLKTTVGHKALVGLLVFLMFCLESYNVNCIQVGHCTTWASILTLVFVGYAGFVAFLILSKRIDPNLLYGMI